MDNDLSTQFDLIHRKLDQLLADRTKPNQRFLGIVDAARYAGLSPESVRRLIAGGRLTAYRPVKGRVVVDVRQLDALVLGSTTMPRTGRGRVTVSERQ